MRKISCHFLVAFCIVLSAGCSETIEEGEFRFLKIGATKDQVIRSAADAGITDITPGLNYVLEVDKGNVSRLRELYGSEALSLYDNKGFVIELEFNQNEVSSVFASSLVPKQTQDLFFDAQTMEEAFQNIEEIMNGLPELHVRNVLANGQWINLQTIDEKGKAYLTRYDVWSFHGQETYSHYRLKFENDKLARILYHWSPVELP